MKKKSIIPFKSYKDPVIVNIQSMNQDGAGIAFYDGYEIYVENAIAGESIKVRIGAPFANGSKRRPGTIVEFLSKSPHRNDEAKLHTDGGVYAYGHLDYEYTLEFKRKAIKEALFKAGVTDIEPLETQRSDISSPSRFKSIRYFAQSGSSVIQGFYKPHSHEVVEVVSSGMEPLWFSTFASDLCHEFTRLKALVYSEKSHQGCLRSLFLRDTCKGRMCVLICAHRPDESVISAYTSICSRHQVNAFFISINGTEGNRILGDEYECLSAADHIGITLNGFDFVATPKTFLQVNYEVASKLYQTAVSWCGESKDDNALDLCCGVGTMTLPLAGHFKAVHGVEIVPDSIEAAKANAMNNHVMNASFETGDITTIMPRLVREYDPYAVICDPSRVGIGPDACRALGALRKNAALVYIFCSLKALSRDVATLRESGFKVEKVQGFDMFPFSSHIETAVLLRR